MCREYELEDFNNDIQAFIEACYQAYIDFWNTSPTFRGMSLQRNKNIIEGKEQDFWGIVEGHKDDDIDLKRYKKVPLLKYVINEDNISCAEDVLYFRRLYKRKIRIEVFSLYHRFLVVLQEIGQHNKAQLITAHPLSEKQLQKKLKQYKEYIEGGDEPI